MATINGTINDDTLVGTIDADVIYGSTGDDYIRGEGGDDYIDGGEGNDTLLGSDGNDKILGGLGDDSIVGGGGNDTLYGNEGNDNIDGGDGADLIYGGVGNDTIYGGIGNDRLYGGEGIDKIRGGLGDDYLNGGADDDVLFGEAGNDKLVGGAGNDVLWGGDGNDTQYGGTGDDYLWGENGVDWQYGGDGNDVLLSGDGDDFMYGGKGNDMLFGQAGSDYMDGGEGDDKLEGYFGDDCLIGGDGNDDLWAGEDDDKLDGGDGDDVLSGGCDNDQIDGGNGNDLVYGDAINLVVNGDFEEWGDDAGNKWTLLYDNQISGWYSEGNTRIEVQQGQFGGTPANPYTNTVIELDSTVNVSVRQDIDVSSLTASADQEMSFSFDYANRFRGSDNTTSPFDVDVFDQDGNLLFSQSFDNDSTLKTYNHFDATFVIPQGVTGITLSFTGTGASDCIGALIDNVELVAEECAGDDVIDGGNGQDVIFGNGGNDSIDGGCDDDIIDGGTGNDVIYGDDAGEAPCLNDLDTNIVINGDFEEWGDNAGNKWTLLYDNQISGWYSADETRIEVQQGQFGGTPDNPYTNTVIELDSTINTSVRQDINVSSLTQDGDNEMAFSFDFANRFRGSDNTTSPFTVEVFDQDGNVLFSQSFTNDGLERVYHEFETSIIVPQGTESITLAFTGTGNSDCIGALIDNVSLIPDDCHGDDDINGGLGDDTLFGNGGNDILSGGAGNDTLWGGRGDDVLIGGEGNDVFVFCEATGDDTVRDFVKGEDTLKIDASIALHFSDVNAEQVGGSTVLSFANDDTQITLLQFDATTVSADMFDFTVL
ncbi:calcium-binding protein [Enterovibrio paralichthyis]|uniref:calcium-binding protein n=1 Tax=Enterovibrio paralichthyis TaxID=2853805 RepID=UPI001C46C882|nr:calcium-binding protein [Enterovibrio paralichthyis]MBV7299084.1 calcium-binding protein [Enterovibrio paralichthyis]